MATERPTASSDPREMPAAFEVERIEASLKERLFGADKTTVDRYIVLEPLGRGGMGLVYRAFDPRVERVVALKVTRIPEGSTHQARLVREAKSLGRLNHPHVLTVYDVGVANEHVYIATELVEGGDLARWCAEQRQRDRDTVERLLAFSLQAAEGLAAAHEAGLVHRDVKPSNLLLDGESRLRVADFGLARDVEAAEASLSTGLALTSEGDTPLTATGAVLGTPAYMAPEQHRGAADASSDQFSWAMSFWEALYGTRPYEADELRSAAESSLPPPADPPRDVPVPRWFKSVLLRALAGRPEDRFADMGQVVAAMRTAQRGRGPARTIGAVGVMLLGVIGAGLLVDREEPPACTGSDTALDGVWDDVQRDRVRAALIRSELAYGPRLADQVQRTADAWAEAYQAEHQDACEATMVRREQTQQVMANRMACLARRKRDARARLDMITELEGEDTARATKLVGGLPDVAQCGDLEYLAAAVAPPEDEATAVEVERIRDELAQIRALRHAGRYEDATPRAVTAVADAEATGYGPIHAEALLERGRILETEGAANEPLAALREAVIVGERVGHHRLVLDALSPLSQVLSGDRATRTAAEEGLWFARRAMALAEHLGDDSARTRALLESSLGRGLLATGRLDEGFAALERALALRLEDAGPLGISVAETHVTIGLYYAKSGRFSDAESHLEKAISIWEQTLGLEHPKSTNALHNLAQTLFQMERDAEALELHQRALEVRERVFGPHHRRVASSLAAIGAIYRRRGDDARALDALERALTVQEHAGGRRSTAVASLLTTLGNAHASQKDFQSALGCLHEAASIYEELRPQDLGLSRVLFTTAIVYWRMEDEAEAEAYLRKMLANEDASGRPPNDMRVRALYQLSDAVRKQGRLDEAIPLLEDAIAMAHTVEIPPNLWGKLWFGLAQRQWDQGDRDVARHNAHKALSHFGKSETHPERVEMVQRWLADNPLP